MHKVLVILGMFQPRPSANGICAEKIIRALKDNGYTVDCLANQNMKVPFDTVADGISIYRIKTRLVYRLFEWVEYNKDSRFYRLVQIFATILNKIKLVISLPRWPLISKSYMKRFTDKAVQLHNINQYDIVIGVYAPIDAAMAACNLKKYDKSIKCILYFLDSLSGGYGIKLLPPKFSFEKSLKYEQCLMETADKIVIMKSSEEHNRKYNGRFLSKMSILDVPLLFNATEASVATDNELMNFVYVGSISASTRDPSFLIQVLLAASQYPICLTFAGEIDCLEMFSPIRERYGSRVHFLGRVSHEDAIGKMMSADVLMNIGNTNASMVPSKIFEYMSSRKPIITTYPDINEPSLQYLNEYPLTLALDERRTDYNNIAAEAFTFAQGCRGVKINFATISERFYLNTPDAFVDVADNILKENTDA